MKIQNASHRAPATQSNESPRSGGRDAREGAQDGEGTATANNPPVHKTPTHGFGRFLWQLDPETPIDAFPDEYQDWRESQATDRDGGVKQ